MRENSTSSSASPFRRMVYVLLIVTAAGAMTGRILAVKSKRGETPLLSANDRSRWCTIRALAEHGTYGIDHLLFTSRGRRDPEWYTIDLVKHRGPDGREHYYSSKPPLLPTLLAAQYWLLKATTGATLGEQPFFIVRTMLIINNVLPLVLYFWLLSRLVERWGRGDWDRVFAMGVATWGTLVTTFAVTLNNHLPAAVSVLVAVWAVVPIFCGESRAWPRFVLAGLASAFAATNELPALSFLALVGVLLLWQAPRATMVYFAPAVLVVAAAFFGTNYLAHQSWRPAYAHRGDGPLVTVLKGAAPMLDQADHSSLLAKLAAEGIEMSEEASIGPSPRPNHWTFWDPATHTRLALVTINGDVQVRQWDHWYEYPDSYWLPERKAGVDRGEPSRLVYGGHVLIGHHGILSLTPVWLFSIAGIAIWLRGGNTIQRSFAAAVLLLTLVCLAFYLSRPLADRNYGGVNCGFRWMLWFVPLWLLCALPALDRCAGYRRVRVLAWCALWVSVVSSTYPAMNPWSHPWLFNLMSHLGWIHY